VILSQEYPLHEADLQVGRISILSDEVRGAWKLVSNHGDDCCAGVPEMGDATVIASDLWRDV